MKNSPTDASWERSRVLVEEIACAIANAQAALLAGRFADLERCVNHQQELCIALTKIHQDATKVSGDTNSKILLITAAQRTRQQNKIFGAELRRMQGHLETLRRLLNGPSLTYQPKRLERPGEDG